MKGDFAIRLAAVGASLALIALGSGCSQKPDELRRLVANHCNDRAANLRTHVDLYGRRETSGTLFHKSDYPREVVPDVYFCESVRKHDGKLDPLTQEFRTLATDIATRRWEPDVPQFDENLFHSMKRLVEIFDEVNRYPLR